MSEVCGTCAHKAYISGEWTCGNEDSEMCGIETEYNYTCEEWEEKDG